MNIEGRLVTLRAIEERDLEQLHRWANDPTIQSMLGGWHFPVSMRDQQTWFERLSVGSLDQRFAIETPELGLIGTANIVSIDWQNGTAFHGMLLGDKETRGKGYALDTVMTLMRYAFEELRLERLDGDMIASNEASIRFYTEKCGWKREGIRRDWFFRRGRRWDKIIVGVSRADFYEHARRTGYWSA